MFRWLLFVSALLAFLPVVRAQDTPTGGLQAPFPNSSSVAHASGADQTPPMKFKSQSVLVQVPAVVTDKQGAHIHNLTKSDFVLLENGKEQKIAFVEEITATNSRPKPAAGSPGTFSNLAFGGEQPRSVTVIVLDNVNTPFLDQVYGRTQLIKYLGERLDSDQPLCLMSIGHKGARSLTGFVNDPHELIKILKKVGSELPAMQGIGENAIAKAITGQVNSPIANAAPPMSAIEAQLRDFVQGGDAIQAAYQQERATEDTLQAFLSIAWSLSGVPGRKSLVWATGSFPFILDSVGAAPANHHLAALYERLMEAFNDAQISVYPVDVGGLASVGSLTNYSGATLESLAARNALQEANLASLNNFADMTGGRAFYNNNDLVAGFRNAVEDSSSYYLLGYYFDSHSAKAGWQKLHVKSIRKEATVRARTGFMVGHATINPESTRDADIDFALASPFESTGIPVVLRWQGAPEQSGKNKRAQFVINVPPASVVNESDKNRFDVEFVWQANKNGVPLDKRGQVLRGVLNAGALAKLKTDGVLYNNALELPSGNYQVRFVVRDNLTGRVGSVSAPLTVN